MHSGAQADSVQLVPLQWGQNSERIEVIDIKWKACNSCRCALMRREAPQNQWIKRHYSRVIETASSPFSRKFHSQAGLALEGYS